jgi:anti-sigma B factor antagonist
MSASHLSSHDDDGGRPSSAELTTTHEGDGRWTVFVRGEVDVAELPRVRSCINELFADQPRHIVLDLTDMTFIDSSGLGVLVSALKRSRELDETTLVLRNLQEPVRRVFEITRLTELFQIEP